VKKLLRRISKKKFKAVSGSDIIRELVASEEGYFEGDS
jgi:hypothetical protein